MFASDPSLHLIVQIIPGWFQYQRAQSLPLPVVHLGLAPRSLTSTVKHSVTSGISLLVEELDNKSMSSFLNGCSQNPHTAIKHSIKFNTLHTCTNSSNNTHINTRIEIIHKKYSKIKKS